MLLSLAKVVHVVAVGLWFGAAVFFLVVGAILFPYFEAQAALPAAERPIWLPVGTFPDPEGELATATFPSPLRKEQGVELAGAMVGALVPWYFAIQGVCGLLAVATAWGWTHRPGRLHTTRAVVLLLALGGVAAGWSVAEIADGNRETLTRSFAKLRRNPLLTNRAAFEEADPDNESAREIEEAESAQKEFTRWYDGSIAINALTLLLVTVGLALAARLPNRGDVPPPRPMEPPAPEMMEPSPGQETPAPDGIVPTPGPAPHPADTAG
jgi:hypothetical protein